MGPKIGRNDPCPCGSGKRYKKCHGDPLRHQAAPSLPAFLSEDTDPHRFRVKGDKAEEVVRQLAGVSFLAGWCFARPKREHNSVEFCDLLVVFDDIAIIWQVKDVSLRPDGTINESKFRKNIRQVHGAWRALFVEKEALVLQNERRKRENFDPSSIGRVFLVSVMMGEPPKTGRAFVRINDKSIHLFYGVDLEVVMRELDTISDFVEYLEARQAVFERSDVPLRINGGEENLLAFYMAHNRSFTEMTKHEAVEIGEDAWLHWSRSPAFLARKEADRISRIWDRFVDRAHTIDRRSSRTDAEVRHEEAYYERLAREMAKPNRFLRRNIVECIRDGYLKASAMKELQLLRRVFPYEKCTYCFLFYNPTLTERERKGELLGLMMVARGMFRQVPTLIGISMPIGPVFVTDFALAVKPTWTDDDEALYQRARNEFGVLRNPQFSHKETWEYPQRPIDVE